MAVQLKQREDPYFTGDSAEFENRFDVKIEPQRLIEEEKVRGDRQVELGATERQSWEFCCNIPSLFLAGWKVGKEKTHVCQE